ncbi:MAG: Zn-ribbon domain-containing OB-fold protein [Dehalococcoidia bacterium]|nr:Zn-ribbon domain-containing OB-fold protein [Dehalococcoidia bacterium]
MPKQSPVADDLDRPFWDACNAERLVIQHCNACGRFQHPPQPVCDSCGSAAQLVWREVSGRGTIYSYGVVYDTPISALQGDQPYNVAVIELADAPGINMMSHLPGTPVDEVPIGAPVTLIFEVTPGNGQKVPEWRVAR